MNIPRQSMLILGAICDEGATLSDFRNRIAEEMSYLSCYKRKNLALLIRFTAEVTAAARLVTSQAVLG